MPDIDIKFLPHQMALFKNANPTKGLYCGRGAGKSFYLNTCANLDLVQGKKVMFFAQTFHVLTCEFMPAMVEQLWTWGFKPEFNKTARSITIGNGGVIYGFSYENADACRGVTGCDSVYYDEIAKAKNLNELFAAVAFTQRAAKTKTTTTFASTPRKGSMTDKWVQTLPPASVIRGVTMRDNTHVTEDEIRNIEALVTDKNLYRQEMLGEIIDGDIEFAVFPSELFRMPRKAPNGFRSLGIDCSGAGRDNNCFIVSDDSGIVDKVKIQVADTFRLADIGRQLIEKWDCRLVNIDGTGGFGNGLGDMLKTQYDFIHLVNFGQGAVDSEHYANARAEMFYTLRADMESGFCMDDPEIREELELFSFNINASGKTQLVPKETIKKVLGNSPDASDALALSRYNRANPAFNSRPLRIDTAELVEGLSGW